MTDQRDSKGDLLSDSERLPTISRFLCSTGLDELQELWNMLTSEEKFDLDVGYVDNQSLWLDIKILFMTVAQLFKRADISRAGRATMEEFGGSTR